MNIEVSKTFLDITRIAFVQVRELALKEINRGYTIHHEYNYSMVPFL